MTHTEQLAKWSRDLSRAIAAQGSDEFFPHLFTALRGQAEFDYPQVWLYHKDLPPRVVYHEIPAEAQAAQLDPYLDGPYRENPFYQASMNQPRSRIYRLARLASSRLKESKYYKQCYQQNGLVDEVVYLARLAGGNVINLCLKRRAHRGEFSDAEYQWLYLVADTVSELVK